MGGGGGIPGLSADCCYLCLPLSTTVWSAVGQTLEEAIGFSLLGCLCISDVRLSYSAHSTMDTRREVGLKEDGKRRSSDVKKQTESGTGKWRLMERVGKRREARGDNGWRVMAFPPKHQFKVYC